MCKVRLALVLAAAALTLSGTAVDVSAAPAASWHLASSFGRHGIAGLPVRDSGEEVLYPPGPGDYGSLLAPGPSGSLYVGGYARSKKGTFVLARMSSRGTLVKSFGRGGVTSAPDIYSLPGDPPRMIALRGGDLLLLGLERSGHLVAVRLNDLGKLDRGFGHAGVAQYQLPGAKRHPIIAAATVQANGDILAVFFRNEVPQPENQPRITRGLGEGAPELVRLLPSGALDGSFGRGGFLEAAGEPLVSGEEFECGVALAPDGSVLLAYESASLSGTAAFPAVQELTPAGADDTSFGTGGVALLPFTPSFEGEDSIVFGGLFALPGGGVEASFGGSGQLVRFTAAGALDSSFGTAGHSAAGRSAVSELALAVNGETFWVHTAGRSVTVGGWLATGAPDPALGGAAGLRVGGLSDPRPEEEQLGLELLPGAGSLSLLYGEDLVRLVA